jgi:pyruvate/2-oxoglutarate dehydrogenase complex dihydrolipoamide acyltransferase (E2) component
MGYLVKMPKLGMDMDQGTLVRWLVDEDETVQSGQVIAEIESEKTTGEVESREDGVVHHILLDVGESVEPGGDIAIVGGADEDVSTLLAESDGAAADSADAGGTESATLEEAASADDAASPGSAANGQSGDGSAAASASTRVKASPRAKKRAEELGVDLAGVEGSGPQGAVAESDVEAAAESGPDDATTDQEGDQSSEASVKASPRAKKRAEELGVDLTTIDGTGAQGSVSESDVEAAAEAAAETSSSADTETETGPSTTADLGDAEERVFAPPRVRRLARQAGVDLATLAGSGPNGAITEADVEAAAGGAPDDEATPSAPGTRDEERPLSGMRRTIADRLGASYREAVHVTEHRTANAEELLAAASAADEGLDPKISVTDVLLLALSATLDEHPAFNATFEDDVHRLHEAQNLCVAVDIDAGLVAPVVRDVGDRSLSELAEARRAVTARATSGEYTMDDLTGGTFTVSNLGVLGVESFDPVINPPQVAILGVNTIQDAVVPTDDGIGVRKQISFDLSFDHRVVDGADAARFLGTLVEHVEDPWPLVVAAGGR